MSVYNQSSKIPKQGKTIFAIMSELAAQHQAIDLSRGYPNFDADKQLIDLVCKNLNAGNNQYAPVDGIMSLREAIGITIKQLYAVEIDPRDEITITNGATEAIYTTISAFIREKDEVIIFEPAYDCYAPAVKLNGGIPVYIDMNSPKFSFDWESVQQAITSNTRIIIINSPHNPTGTVLTAWDIQKLKKVINGTNIIILSDEVYEHVIFDGAEHESLLKYPEFKDRTLIISSFGKTFHVTGWRLGYVIASKELMSEFRKIHQFSMYSANTPIQYAFAEYLTRNPSLTEVGELYEQKRNLLGSLLANTPFKLTPPCGTYFQCIDYSQISEESDFEFASRLIREFKVATIPLSYFYKGKTDNKILRLCFAKDDETLKQAVENLRKVF
jgi:methionine aminotransferase